jgi:sporulation protein YlmC with PRC-barrel domain
MSRATQFTIGTEVVCQDGVCGVLRRVVINPVTHTLTHLVVEPKYRQNLGHLVPIDLVEKTDTPIALHCTMDQFKALDDAEETELLAVATGQLGYGQADMLSLPYFGLRPGTGLSLGGLGGGMGGLGGLSGLGGLGGAGFGAGPRTVTYDNVPPDEVEVGRGEHVHATDGSIGRVQGLVVDPASYHVTHVLLEEGHLWGKREVAIPIGAVTNVDDGIRLNLTKDQVKELPAVDIDHPPDGAVG